jgi:signal transduction histidine kinase
VATRRASCSHLFPRERTLCCRRRQLPEISTPTGINREAFEYRDPTDTPRNGLSESRLPELILHDHIADTSAARMNLCEDRAARATPLAPRSETWQKHIAAIGWLSTSIVHDLRNPLGTVFAGAEMLLELDLSPAQVKRLAANIHHAAGRMRELLADLASAGRGNRSTHEMCKISDVIAAASEAVLADAEKRRVRILNHVSDEIEIPLSRSRMERVFINLITNALEAMSYGGEIRIGVRRAENSVLIQVEDTGPGIPCGIRDRLFEPFVTAGKKDGLGLGLALARQTVLDHGGDIWTEPAAGGHFTIRLPTTRDRDVL